MEQKKTDNPSEMAFHGVWRLIKYSRENQVFPINIREFLGKSVSLIIHCLLNHFVAPGHRRIVSSKGIGTREPMVPFNLVSLGQFQVVTEKESQYVDFHLNCHSLTLGSLPR
ncbi:MAG: hypothetical protein ABW157_06290 [Candidatus Thiodiazotropha sp. LLP2]